ncbi:MAG: NAD-dependent epimerase/dehydratase family protein [Dehalococcoidia bacterium]|nr:NAD-dependent epimerase/dehydratase family protein [Dehalococcoidia bacterium]
MFITGAAGFGGSHLAAALLERCYRVTGLDVTPPSRAGLLRGALLNECFRYLWKSVQDVRTEDIEGHAVVVHLAAQADAPLAFESPRYTIMQNIDGTVALLEAVRRAQSVSKVLFAGSGNEIGRARYTPIDEEHPLTPHNPYGFSKAAAEMALEAWRLAYGVPSVVMRSGVVVGPNMRQEVFLFRWLRNALHGKPIVVEGGKQTRDLAFIDDVVRAWMLVIEAPVELVVGEKFFVGSGEEYAIEELAEMCRDAVGSDAPIEYAAYRPGEEGHREAFSIEKARRVLGYAPRVSPKEAVALTAEWVRAVG